MQEVALAAVRQAAPLADAEKVAPWLYRLAVRQALLLSPQVRPTPATDEPLRGPTTHRCRSGNPRSHSIGCCGPNEARWCAWLSRDWHRATPRFCY